MGKKKKAKKEDTTRRWAKRLSRWVWVALLIPVLGLALMLMLAANSNLPTITELEDPRSDLATEILFTDGSQMGQYYRQNRINSRYDELSPHLVKALIATEDERFYNHSGVDLRGSIRAAVYMGKKGGASTITQQLSKMLFSSKPSSSAKRIFQKFQEWIIAAQLERRYTKEEIIAMYMNRFDWNYQGVGIRSSSQVYFNTIPDSLRIEEAAMLIGMCKNPSLFNPIRRPDTTLHRRMVVLAQMKKQEMISQLEYDSLKALPLGLDFHKVDHAEGPAPYFREILRAELQQLFDEKLPGSDNYKYAKTDGTPYDIYTDGLRIYTTLDPRMQEYAEYAVKEHMTVELQRDLFRDLRKKKNRPFDYRVTKKEIDQILTSAMKRSDRYKIMVGKRCAECERPGSYIKKEKDNGEEVFHCLAIKGGCGHKTHVVPEDSIPIIFDKPVKMRVFTWKGEQDTVMSPMDSIRHYKSYLQAGLMSMDPANGFVKAWVGGIDYKHFQYDHVRQSRRQVGSTFKPFVYATAIREGMSPCMELPNQKVCFDMPEPQPQWCPENSDKKYGGMVTLKFALANSINTVTAWLMKQYGPEAVTVLARHMGIKSELQPVPSLCLGVADLTVEEMTGAFASFANKGVHIDPIIVTRIEDKSGNTIFEVLPNTYEALDERTSYVMLQLLKGVVDGAYNRESGRISGTGVRMRMAWGNREKYANIKYPMAGKTGTTQNNSDGWFMGITPDLVTGVWVGAEDRSVRFSATAKGQGANTALPIYGYYMNRVYDDKTIKISTGDFEKPAGNLGIELDCQTVIDQNAGPIWDN